jgi:hypothetical protein
MRIRSDFVVTPAAHQRLFELGHKHVARMNGADGWGISVEVPDGEFVCVRTGNIHQPSRWDLVKKIEEATK